MCGRFVLLAPREAVEALFSVTLEGPYEPRFNIAPTQPVLYVDQSTGFRQASYARWGLIPHWHKDPQNAQLLINARSETVLDKPSFKTAMRHKRCLIPATHFYEWERVGKHKQPYAVERTSPDGADGLFAFAALYDTWSGKDGETLVSLAILTQEALEPINAIHHRMPVVVPPEHFESWLDCRQVDDHLALEPLLSPQADEWRLWAVDPVVNRAGVEGAQLLDRVEPKAPEPEPAKDQLDLF